MIENENFPLKQSKELINEFIFYYKLFLGEYIPL